MEQSGRNRSQPVAAMAPAETAQTGENRLWVATGCRVKPMVRRGSTVRVRQRALQKRRIVRFFCRRNLHNLQRAVGMEPFMEPPGPEHQRNSAFFAPQAGRALAGPAFAKTFVANGIGPPGRGSGCQPASPLTWSRLAWDRWLCGRARPRLTRRADRRLSLTSCRKTGGGGRARTGAPVA